MASFRNFDNRDRYYDRNGNPLHGCVQFMVKDGNTSAEIFDGDHVPLANPQLTDSLGRTVNQVFVDVDVIAYMYKYVGDGRLADEEAEGIDTRDESKWSLQYTVESASVDMRQVDGQSSMGVATMQGLRELDPAQVPLVDGIRMVTLEGYYAAGDKEPINYVFDSQSEADDDNGSVIQSEHALTGRWIMVQPTEHCDSRHFGVFPQDSVFSTVNHTTGIAQLVAYCNAKSIRPFFNGSEAYPYFVFGGLHVNSRNGYDVSDRTVFVDKSESEMLGEFDRKASFSFQNENTTIDSKTVRLSWKCRNHIDTKDFIIDIENRPCLLANTNVVVEANPATGCQFDNCTVDSTHRIGRQITMTNMTVHTDWFVPGYNWANLQLANCRIELSNCESANTYIVLKLRNGERDFGDLGEQRVSDLSLPSGSIAENAEFSNVTIQGDVELHNVSGTVQLTGSQHSLNIIDCWLTITNTEDLVVSAVQWRRGSVTFDPSHHIQVLQTLLLDDVDVQADFYTVGVAPKYRRCRINVRQDNFTDYEYIGCEVNADIYQFPEYITLTYADVDYPGYVYRGLFAKNTVTGSAKIYLSPVTGVDYSSSPVSTLSHWEGNFSDHNFVDDSRWTGISYSGAVSRKFEYLNNYGGCPTEKAEITYTMPYSQLRPYGNTPYVDYGIFCANVPGTTDSTGIWVVHDGRTTPERDISWDDYWIVNFKDVVLPIDKLFRLPNLKGNQHVNITADITCFIRPDGFPDWPFYTNTFHVESVLLNSNVTGNAQVAYASSFRPIKFHYTGIRYCDNDGIDDWNSSLDQVLYAAQDEPSKFGFAGQCRYSYHLD